MRRLFALTLLLAGCDTTPPVERIGGLARKLRTTLGDGEWGVFSRELRDGETLEIRGEEEFPAGALPTLLVMAKLHLDVAAGRYRLEDERTVEKSFPRAAGGSFEIDPSARLAALLGKRVSLRRLLEFMIVEEDRVASNNLIAQAGGPAAVTNFARSQGLQRSDLKGYLGEPGVENVAVPREYGRLLDSLWRGETVSASASSEMGALLSRQRPNASMAAALPKGTRVALAADDAGIVLAPRGAFVAVFLSRTPRRTETVAAGTRLLYDHVESKR